MSVLFILFSQSVIFRVPMRELPESAGDILRLLQTYSLSLKKHEILSRELRLFLRTCALAVGLLWG
jgi:hypothetical protein